MYYNYDDDANDANDDDNYNKKISCTFSVSFNIPLQRHRTMQVQQKDILVRKFLIYFQEEIFYLLYFRTAYCYSVNNHHPHLSNLFMICFFRWSTTNVLLLFTLSYYCLNN